MSRLPELHVTIMMLLWYFWLQKCLPVLSNICLQFFAVQNRIFMILAFYGSFFDELIQYP